MACVTELWRVLINAHAQPSDGDANLTGLARGLHTAGERRRFKGVAHGGVYWPGGCNKRLINSPQPERGATS